jgi:hypothetical protein
VLDVVGVMAPGHSMASPLHWPRGWQRRDRNGRRRNPKWRSLTVYRSCQDIETEVRRMQGHGLVISTNLALRIDAAYRKAAKSHHPDAGGDAAGFVRLQKARLA